MAFFIKLNLFKAWVNFSLFTKGNFVKRKLKTYFVIHVLRSTILNKVVKDFRKKTMNWKND